MVVLEVVVNKKGYTIVKCDNCSIEFYCQNFRIKKHKHLFCCKKCESEYKKGNSVLNCKCENCGKLFHLKPYRKNKIKHLACSNECSLELRRIYSSGENNHQYGLKGQLNSSWKSDVRISVYGYKLIRSPNHPFKNGDGFVFEHRLIAEQYLLTDTNSIEINNKKYLSPEYIVHHIDFDKLNNDVSNLCIMELSEHTKFHTLYKSYINEKNLKDEQIDFLVNIIEKYNLPYKITIKTGETFAQGIITQFFKTIDDKTDGIRNGGFGSTTIPSERGNGALGSSGK